MKRLRFVGVLLALGCSMHLDAAGQEPMRFFKGGELQKLELTRAIDDESKRQAIASLPKRKSDFAYPIWTVPTMANGQGLFGAFFKTRLAMFNPTTLSFVVAARLFNQTGLVDTRQIDFQRIVSRFGMISWGLHLVTAGREAWSLIHGSSRWAEWRPLSSS